MSQGLIDLHNHILPGIDDGCASLESSVDTAHQYVASGFSTVVATPHNIKGSAWSASPEKITVLTRQIQEELDSREIALTVLSGMEIALSGSFWDNFHQGAYIPLGKSSTYLLEFPFQQTGLPSFLDLCRSLTATDTRRFLIAHPERCEYFQNNLQTLALLFENGCRIQLNFGSILGWYGRNSQRTAFAILKNRLCHIIATDSHGTAVRRVPSTKDLAELVKNLGEDGFKQAMLHNPQAILDDESPFPLTISPDILDKWQHEGTQTVRKQTAPKRSFIKSITSFLR